MPDKAVHCTRNSPVCVLMCPRMLDFETKFCEQMSQLNTRFSLCVVRWAFKYFSWANDLKHFSHLNFLAFVCWKTWARKVEKLVQRFWQMKHSLYFRARSNCSSVRFLYISTSSLPSSSSDDDGGSDLIGRVVKLGSAFTSLSFIWI